MTERDRGTFIVSLDLELHWGVRDRRSVEAYRANLDGTRAAVEAMLERFTDRDVPATWAVVGLLYCDGKDEGLRRAPTTHAPYLDANLDPYPDLARSGEDEAADPYHFAPSLLEAIRRHDGQEIGTHTFSHFFCLAEGATPEAFRADLEAAIAVAGERGGPIRSIVFGRNQYTPAYLAVCHDLGLVAYRATSPGPMWTWHGSSHEGRLRRGLRYLDAYLPLSGRGSVRSTLDPSGLVAMPASQFLRPTARADDLPTRLRLRRIRAGMSRAASTGGVFHLWWHPENFGAHLEENLAQLDVVLDHFTNLRDAGRMRASTMTAAAEAFAAGVR